MEKSLEARLEFYKSKTSIISNWDTKKIKIKAKEIEWKDEVTYLGQFIPFQNRREKEISTRIRRGPNNYWGLKKIYKGRLPVKLETKNWELCTKTTITYGARTFRC